MKGAVKVLSWHVPETVISGPGSASRAAQILPGRKPLVITGPHLYKSGTIQPVLTSLQESGLACSVFAKTESDPSIETCEAIAAQFLAGGCDCLLAVGGGSVLDAAKAAAVLIREGGRLQDYEGSGKVKGPVVPLAVIPCTAGTGSEVTPFAVISDHERRVKMTITSPYLIPQAVILDPDLLAGVPASLAAATGMDAMIHALEAYVSRFSSFLSDAFASEALRLIGKNLKPFVKTRDPEAAAGMLEGSFLAGCAFSLARLGLVHAASHPLSAYYGIPHGAANALLLPHVIRFNEDQARERYQESGRLLGADRAQPFADWIEALNAELGIRLKAEVLEEDIPAMCRDALTSGNIQANPRPAQAEDIAAIYRLLVRETNQNGQ